MLIVIAAADSAYIFRNAVIGNIVLRLRLQEPEKKNGNWTQKCQRLAKEFFFEYSSTFMYFISLMWYFTSFK